MFFNTESSSHRPLIDGKCNSLVMRLSSCVQPTVIDKTYRVGLIHMYETLSMIYNTAIMKTFCQIGVRYQ